MVSGNFGHAVFEFELAAGGDTGSGKRQAEGFDDARYSMYEEVARDTA